MVGQRNLHWLYVGRKTLGVCCVLVVCVGRVLVGPILVIMYDQNPGFGGRTLVVRWKNARES